MSGLQLSWIDSANSPETLFPLNNLPYGVFSVSGDQPRCGVAIGDMVLDVAHLERSRLIDLEDEPVLQDGAWNALMALDRAKWAELRARLVALLSVDGDPALSGQAALRDAVLVPRSAATMHMPFRVTEYTDFYSSKHHAMNVGTMFRGAGNALPPNWLHLPIGYNGRASSVVVSGTDVTRPRGQLKGSEDKAPRFGPSERFDFELEVGAIVGTPSDGPITVAEADAHIFGYVLLNDWSARDIQAWEYQPLGPFQSKATATTISPWIVTAAALSPFRCDAPPRDVELLDHLRDAGPMLYDIDVSVHLLPAGGVETEVSATNYNVMYFSAAQQLAHHAACGCPMRTGDLLGSGTISGPERFNRGSLLELSWGGQEPLSLAGGGQRGFLEDGDTVIMRGAAKGDGYQIGFGECVGRLRPAG